MQILLQYSMSHLGLTYIRPLYSAHECALRHLKQTDLYFSFVRLRSGTILHSSWQEIKLGTRSSMGIINPRWQRMHDNYKQKLCHSL